MKRIYFAIKFGWYALRQPHLFQLGAFEMLLEIMNMLKNSMETGRPMRSKLVINAEKVMNLWCSTGQSPEQRIDELIDEKEKLKLYLGTLLSAYQSENLIGRRNETMVNSVKKIIEQ